MAYLTRLATKFQRLVSLALNATHGADAAFDSSPTLRIAPSVMSRMKTFEAEIAKYGQTYLFMKEDNNDSVGILHTFVEDDDPEPSVQLFEVRK